MHPFRSGRFKMPTYEFQCDNCGAVTDWSGSYDDRPKTVKCEHCAEGTAHYKISAGLRPVTRGSRGAEEDWNKSSTIGEFWERRGIEPGSEKSKELNKKRVKKLQQKRLQNEKNKKKK